ncbi:hypothetical protein LTR56_002330 [Elasticomyces elasticus]|nr:hypothetical protein LTR56_002330 [Elasticomyces elasticus]KAK3665894.1 hypothetical protein LTR22_003213 [Elasticomyces elasticus]KAK4929366.1 hypothetical protein LTR49_003970 [Elasticomyces elasticus]KAK5764655.1 hypothetical protein LTS12_005156 [Elasticomyces elasticus]
MPHFDADHDLRPHTPSLDTYLRRQAFLNAVGSTYAPLPGTFPTQVQSPSVWTGEDIDLEKLTYVLSANDLQEIREALEAFKRTAAAKHEISSDTFKLPVLSRTLRKIAHEVNSGTGIGIVSGMEPDEYTVEDSIIIHAGISAHVAPLRGCQSGSNDQIFHICNREYMAVTDLRSNSTASALPFHTDDTDILAFYALETSSSGGEMLWASQTQVYNELATDRPEVLGTLAKADWPLQTAADPPAYIEMPIMYNDSKGPYIWLAHGNLTGNARSPRDTRLPPISYEQADALDAVHFAAVKHAVAVAPQKGNFYFVNNFSVFHSRTAYHDDAEETDAHPRGRRRHLLRLWIRDPLHGRDMQGRLAERWAHVFDKESANAGRWLLDREMDPTVISQKLYAREYPADTFNSCQNG